MADGIELHDSTLEAVTFHGTSAWITLGPAYVHRAGSGWLQQAELSFEGVASNSGVMGLPASISDGVLRTNSGVYRNVLPMHGVLQNVALSLMLATGETWEIRAHRLEIRLLGNPTYLETLPADLT